MSAVKHGHCVEHHSERVAVKNDDCSALITRLATRLVDACRSTTPPRAPNLQDVDGALAGYDNTDAQGQGYTAEDITAYVCEAILCNNLDELNSLGIYVGAARDLPQYLGVSQTLPRLLICEGSLAAEEDTGIRANLHWFLAYITGAPPKRTANTTKQPSAPADTLPAPGAHRETAENPCVCPQCEVGHEPFKCPGSARPDINLSPNADEEIDPKTFCLECRANQLESVGMEEDAAAARWCRSPPRCRCGTCVGGREEFACPPAARKQLGWFSWVGWEGAPAGLRLCCFGTVPRSVKGGRDEGRGARISGTEAT